MGEEENNKTINSSSLNPSPPSSTFFCFTRSCCFPPSPTATSHHPSTTTTTTTKAEEENDSEYPKTTKKSQRKHGGWKSMPYVLGNESFERLASFGLLANFMVYLLTQYNMEQVFATNLINIWSGTTNFAPLIGAFISDAYLGKFKTLACASVMSFLGMVALTSTAVIPGLHPLKCTTEQQQHAQCIGPSKGQLGVLYMALGLLTIGAGGIRACSIPFGVDQFNPTTEQGRKGINSFFNWYYFSFTIIIMISMTLIVYIQDSVSWAWGLGIPTALMLCSIILFFIGMRVYVYVSPGESIFSGIAQVFVAAYRKRKLEVPTISSTVELIDHDKVFYDPPLKDSFIVSKLSLTNDFRILNKAAIIVDGQLKPDGSPLNKWKLCSIQSVEEVKCLIRTVPIWASGIICFTAMTQQNTFTVSQALKMDRDLGPKFKIPAGSISVITMLTSGLWIPFYDRILVPRLYRITKKEGGITLLQRMGIGIVFSVLSMVVAGLVEEKRRHSAIEHPRADGIAPISVMWLAPQLVLMGFAEVFSIIAHIEFYYKEFPEHMRSISNSLLFCSTAGANYLSTFIVAIVHNNTGKQGKPDWLDNNINVGRVDYFYYVIAGLGVVNFVYFLICAHRYRYKGSTVRVKGEDNAIILTELNLTRNVGV